MSTIAAISTATGEGGIGIVRLSGEDCFKILEKIFLPKKKEMIEDIKGYQIKYGTIIKQETGQIIDEVLVSYFKEPKSYTTENMCEINSHGGRVILQMVLEECLKAGATLAEPGEFTKRAFLNGRIDLAQAESIMDLIHAKSEKEAIASEKHLEGELSRKIGKIRSEILNQMADIEASIDYPEYDIEEVTNQKLKARLEEIKQELEKLEKSFETGKILKEGVKTVIVGKPNSGKSSLLNTMLKEERAIVSDEEGTTRDTIEEMVTVQGIPLKLIDTAGIRDASNQVEKIGVDKALRLIDEAELIIMLIDASSPLEEEDRRILEKIKDKNAIILLNKIDQADFGLEKTEEIINLKKDTLKVSIKNGEGIEKLYEKIVKMFHGQNLQSDSEIIISNIRQKNQIHLAFVSCQNAIQAIEENMPIDVVSIEMKAILENLGEIIGDNVSDSIITEIFSKFCLGK